MTEFNSGAYARGFHAAAEDIASEGLAWAKSFADSLTTDHWYCVGYQTCVSAYFEGAVR